MAQLHWDGKGGSGSGLSAMHERPFKTAEEPSNPTAIPTGLVPMTTFETIEKHETEFGNNDFLQVARKVAKSDESSTEFIAVTRGYLDSQGSRRYKTNLTIPPDPDLVGFLREALSDVEAVTEDPPEPA